MSELLVAVTLLHLILASHFISTLNTFILFIYFFTHINSLLNFLGSFFFCCLFRLHSVWFIHPPGSSAYSLSPVQFPGNAEHFQDFLYIHTGIHTYWKMCEKVCLKLVLCICSCELQLHPPSSDQLIPTDSLAALLPDS